MEIHIDLETYSGEDIKNGVHKYVEHPDFEIMLLGFAVDNEPVILYDLKSGDTVPVFLQQNIENGNIMKFAHNAPFEIACLRKHLGLNTTADHWTCTAVMAAELGLPRSLGQLSEALKFSADKAKDKEGKALIRYFCVPCKPTKVNGGRTRNLPHHDPEKWAKFKEYCKQDVVAEREVHRVLKQLWIDPTEWDNWRVDQVINNRGAMVDLDLVANALKIKDEMTANLLAEARQITGLANPNSTAQLKDWLVCELMMPLDNLRAETVKDLLEEDLPGHVRRVLQIRQMISKSSIKKYDALRKATNADSRIRGTLLFVGAMRTGRWAGRVFQPQNLPRNYLKDLDTARTLLKTTDYDTMSLMYDDVADTMSQLIRTAIVPRKGCKFIVADFSAVEARNLAWYANEEWRLNIFRCDGKIYEASAAKAFNVPIETIVKGHENYGLRAQGKVLELACGYQGGPGAIAQMDYNNAIPEENRKALVDAWREASPNIVNFWYSVQRSAISAVKNPGSKVILPNERTVKGLSGPRLEFLREKGFLFITLPSGRRLAYPRPMMREGKFGEEISYEGVDQYTRKWERLGTYGGKLVENIAQATCRDLLMYGMTQLEMLGYPVVMHVHDEAIVEVPMDVTVEEVETILSLKPAWAETMPHAADGFETMYYKKD